jgi:hypothetical protein
VALTKRSYTQWTEVEREAYSGATPDREAVIYEPSSGEWTAVVARGEDEFRGMWDVTMFGPPDADELRFLCPDKDTAETILELIAGDE